MSPSRAGAEQEQEQCHQQKQQLFNSTRQPAACCAAATAPQQQQSCNTRKRSPQVAQRLELLSQLALAFGHQQRLVQVKHQRQPHGEQQLQRGGAGRGGDSHQGGARWRSSTR